MISQEIGSRPAGSEAEQAAIGYAGDLFEAYGYDVEVQSFVVDAPDSWRLATLAAGAIGDVTAITLHGSATANVSGPLVDAGTGQAASFPADAAGAIVLVQRLDVTFNDMARRAEDAGAAGVIIANNEPGGFIGRLEPASALPVVAIDQADGEALRTAIATAPLTVDLAVQALRDVTAFNVIARPPSGVCRTISGGHYDSVPWAPGANDNASGAGLVLELARAAASAGLSGHCFALWGAEELGLFGSAAFAERLSEADRDALEAYYNYDVVAGDEPPLVTGSPELIDRAQALAPAELQTGLDPRDIGSDHISFLDAGVPALLVTTPAFDLIHTPSDTLEHLEPTFLGELAALGLALLMEDGQD